VLAPVVSVTKEVPQTGVTNNNWDVNSTTENYTRLDSAAATTLDFVGFNISAASFTDSFSVAAQDTSPRGLAFNTDGTKMFFVGDTGDSVYEYTLSTGFDASTAVYSQNFSVSAQDTAPRDIAFNSDGTKMFVIGQQNDSVYEYTLSTGFDVSTASYVDAFSVSAQETTPNGIAFNTVGTKMFVVGQTGDAVNEYTLSTGFDVSTTTYSQNFSVAAQDTAPQSMTFNTDGTKMFVVGASTADAVYEYTLGTGFDVSTATYSQNFSVAAQNSQPRGLSFNSVGTKMFVTGDGSGATDVYEYNVGASLALGTGSFASADVGKTIEANSGEFILTATDGSFVEITEPTSYDQVASGNWSMYGVVYNSADGDLELSGVTDPATTFDVSTASYSQNFSVSAQETSPQGLAFSTDGTKMFIVGSSGDDVNEYTLSTGFDVSTASFVDSFSVAGQETTSTGIAFNTDGTKMFIVGATGDDVNEYTLSTGFDVSTASFVDSFSVAGQDTSPRGIAFNTDGTKMFIVGATGDDVNEYTLSTGFDVSTASFVDSFSVAGQETVPQGLAFSTDGTKMFIVGSSGDAVNEYTLSTGFDVSTASFVDSFSVAGQETATNGIVFNTDGTKMFIVGSSGADVNEYSVGTLAAPTGYHPVHTTASIDTTYWTDINSMTADQNAGDGNVYYAISTDDRTTWTVIDNTDGERDIVRNNAGTWQYNSNGTYASETWVNGTTNAELATLAEAMEGASSITNAFDVSTAAYSQSFSVASQDGAPQGVAFNSTGTKMFIVGEDGNDVNEYTLSTGFNVSTASYSQNFSVSSQDTSPRDIAFNADGTKMFIAGRSGNAIYEYTLSTGYDVSTSSFVDSLNIFSQESEVEGLTFSTDGTKMFIVGGAGDEVNEYDLSIGFDLSTASFSQNFSVSAQETQPFGISFNTDGTKMLIVGATGRDVNEYDLTTGFDVSTASFVDSFSVSSQATNPNGIAFNTNGTKMFITCSDTDNVYEYNVGTASYTNQMDKTQLDAVTDPNHIALGNDLDLAIIFNMTSGSIAPSSDGVAINYDANVLNKGAVLGTDYDFDAPAQNSVRITALAGNNLKVRII
jgi:DNA-binding beta-propeller fold protein YncE